MITAKEARKRSTDLKAKVKRDQEYFFEVSDKFYSEIESSISRGWCYASLVIKDDPNIVKLVLIQLKELGFEVNTLLDKDSRIAWQRRVRYNINW